LLDHKTNVHEHSSINKSPESARGSYGNQGATGVD
jgi:hypothetical protein